MNQRERILAISVLAAVILAVGGFLFKWLFLDGLGRIKADIETVKLEINKKGADRRKELDEEKALERDDPRLTQWQVRSLPEDNNREAYIKSGHSAEEARKHHEDMVQVDYSHYLNDLVVKSGFTANSIKISSAPADRKGGPILSGKTPAYTRHDVHGAGAGQARFGGALAGGLLRHAASARGPQHHPDGPRSDAHADRRTGRPRAERRRGGAGRRSGRRPRHSRTGGRLGETAPPPPATWT